MLSKACKTTSSGTRPGCCEEEKEKQKKKQNLLEHYLHMNIKFDIKFASLWSHAGARAAAPAASATNGWQDLAVFVSGRLAPSHSRPAKVVGMCGVVCEICMLPVCRKRKKKMAAKGRKICHGHPVTHMLGCGGRAVAETVMKPKARVTGFGPLRKSDPWAGCNFLLSLALSLFPCE